MGWLAKIKSLLFGESTSYNAHENLAARIHARTCPDYQPVFQIFTPDYQFKVAISNRDATTFRIVSYHWSQEEYASFWEEDWKAFTDNVEEAKKLATERLKEIADNTLLESLIYL